ncbi:MAG: NAD-dependent epimerase/dehydratase family protein [Bryobacteraceae bacterium]
MTILVTGTAGFIGYHLAARLLAEGRRVVGVDNLNSYYDPRLKRARLQRLATYPAFEFVKADLAERWAADAVFARGPYDVVIHLAAQAGVRHSLENPHAYTESNVTGFLHVLEGCRRSGIERLIYASSSSVYAGNRKTPFAVGDPVETPVSLYAATKRAGELMAHCYSHLFGIATTGLRFFTVYGPWGRPDMAPFKFVEAIERGQAIDLYNFGRMQRDFTYVDDVVEGLVRVIDRSHRGHRLYNVGHGSPVGLLEFVHTIERALGKRARKRFLPIPPGDVVTTHAEVEEFYEYTGFYPATPVARGVEQLVSWYREYSTSRRSMVAV